MEGREGVNERELGVRVLVEPFVGLFASFVGQFASLVSI